MQFVRNARSPSPVLGVGRRITKSGKLLNTGRYAGIAQPISANQSPVRFVVSHPSDWPACHGWDMIVVFAQAALVLTMESVKRAVAIDCWNKQRMVACYAKLAMSKVRFLVLNVSSLCPLAEVSSARRVTGAGC